MSGMMMSLTKELTIAPQAAPMMTPTARSTTLPRMANFLNSSSIDPSRESTRFHRRQYSARMRLRRASSSVDQAGMHHGFAHRRARLVGKPHHRQPHGLGALAQH